MNLHRLASLALAGVVGGTVGWFLKDSPSSFPQPDSIDGSQIKAIQTTEGLSETEATEQWIDELSTALAEARHVLAERERTIATLQAALAEANQAVENTKDQLTYPEGLGEKYPDLEGTVKPTFESQPVSPAWAEPAKSEIAQSILSSFAEVGLSALDPEVECRTDICRVRLTYLAPVEEDEIMDFGKQLRSLGGHIVVDSDSVSMGAIEYRAGFPGELPTSEFYLFRRGSAQWPLVFITPEQHHAMTFAPKSCIELEALPEDERRLYSNCW